MLLAELNPTAADTILARGMMYGDSRVIVGAHWQSDVDAGRLAGSAAVLALHNNAEFLEDQAKAAVRKGRSRHSALGSGFSRVRRHLLPA